MLYALALLGLACELLLAGPATAQTVGADQVRFDDGETAQQKLDEGELGGAPATPEFLLGSLNVAIPNGIVIADLLALNNHLATSIADGPHTTVGASHIDAITEIDATLRSGTDGQLITGTPTTGECAEWDANGDVIGAGAACGVGGGSGDVVGPASSTDHAVARFDLETGKLLQDSSATVDDAGNVAALSYSTPDVDGSNRLELYGNPSGDVPAPSGDDVAIFAKDDGGLYAKRAGDAAGGILAAGAGVTYKIGTFSFAPDPVGGTQATLADQQERDPGACISRVTNEIVISCAGTYLFHAAARWDADRTESTGDPGFAGGVYWYRETAPAAYLAGSSLHFGCEGAPIVAEAVVTTPPVNFSIYPGRCDSGGTLAGMSGEQVLAPHGRYRVERVQ